MTQHHIPEDLNLYQYHCENQKSHILYRVSTMSAIKGLRMCLLTTACLLSLPICPQVTTLETTSKDLDKILYWKYLQQFVNTYQICLRVKENEGQFM
jgi:hypothetical protein